MENQNIVDPTKVGTSGIKGLPSVASDYDSAKDLIARSSIGHYRKRTNAPLSYSQKVAQDFSEYEPTQTYNVGGFGDSSYDSKLRSKFQLSNLNEFRAHTQGNWDAFANGLVKMTGRFVTSFADCVIGTVVGLGAMALTGKGSAFYDNAWSNLLSDVNDYLENNFTTYKTYDQAHANFFSKDWWSMANISDTVITNLGFALGTMAGIAVTGRGLDKLISGGARAFTATGDLFKGGKEVAEVARAAKVAKNVEQGTQALKTIGKANKIANYKNITGTILAGLSESRMEGLDAKKDTYNNLENALVASVQERKKMLDAERGNMTQEEYDNALMKLESDYQRDLGQAEKVAEREGLNTFLVNVPITTLADVVMFGRTFTGFKGLSKLARNTGRISEKAVKTGEKVIEKGGKEVAKEATKYAVKGAALRPVSASVKGTAAEGLQELFQDSASQMFGKRGEIVFGNYLASKYDDIPKQQLDNLLLDFAKTFLNYAGTNEGSVAFGTGALMGILGGARSAKSSISGVKNDKALAKELTERVNSDKFRDLYQGLIRHRTLEGAKDAALFSQDEFSYKNADFAQLVSDINMFKKAGRLEDIKAMLKGVLDTSTDQNLKALYDFTTEVDEKGNKSGPLIDSDGNSRIEIPEGKAEVRKEIKERKKKILDFIDEYSNTKDKIDRKTGGKLTDEQIEDLTYLNLQLKDWDNRTEGMVTELDKVVKGVRKSQETKISSLKENREVQAAKRDKAATAVDDVNSKIDEVKEQIENLQGEKEEIQTHNSSIDSKIAEAKKAENIQKVTSPKKDKIGKRKLTSLDKKIDKLQGKLNTLNAEKDTADFNLDGASKVLQTFDTRIEIEENKLKALNEVNPSEALATRAKLSEKTSDGKTQGELLKELVEEAGKEDALIDVARANTLITDLNRAHESAKEFNNKVNEYYKEPSKIEKDKEAQMSARNNRRQRKATKNIRDNLTSSKSVSEFKKKVDNIEDSEKALLAVEQLASDGNSHAKSYLELKGLRDKGISAVQEFFSSEENYKNDPQLSVLTEDDANAVISIINQMYEQSSSPEDFLSSDAINKAVSALSDGGNSPIVSQETGALVIGLTQQLLKNLGDNYKKFKAIPRQSKAVKAQEEKDRRRNKKRREQKKEEEEEEETEETEDIFSARSEEREHTEEKPKREQKERQEEEDIENTRALDEEDTGLSEGERKEASDAFWEVQKEELEQLNHESEGAKPLSQEESENGLTDTHELGSEEETTNSDLKEKGEEESKVVPGGNATEAELSDELDEVADSQEQAIKDANLATIGDVEADQIAYEEWKNSSEANKKEFVSKTDGYNSSIPQVVEDKEASAKAGKKRYKKLTEAPEKGDFRAIYAYLEDSGAFDFVNSGQLKVGDEIYYIQDPNFVNGLGHKGKTIFMAVKSGDKMQIIGVLPYSTRSNKFPGLQEVYDRFDKLKEDKTFVPGTPIYSGTRVWNIYPGKIFIGDKSVPLSEILKDGETPKLGIIGNNNILITSSGVSSFSLSTLNLSEKELEQRRGRVYLMVPDGTGHHIPTPLRVKHLNKEEFNISDETVKNTPRGKKIIGAIEEVSKAKTEKELREAAQKLSDQIYLGKKIFISPIFESENSNKMVGIKLTRAKLDGNGNPIIKEDGEYEYLYADAKFSDNKSGKVSPEWIANFLYGANTPLQVSQDSLDDVGYIKELLDSNILSTNLRASAVVDRYFFTTAYRGEVSEKTSKEIEQKIPEPEEPHTNPIGGTESVIGGTPLEVKDKSYTVEGNTVYDSNGNMVGNGPVTFAKDIPFREEHTVYAKHRIETQGKRLAHLEDTYRITKGVFFNNKTGEFITNTEEVESLEREIKNEKDKKRVAKKAKTEKKVKLKQKANENSLFTNNKTENKEEAVGVVNTTNDNIEEFSEKKKEVINESSTKQDEAKKKTTKEVYRESTEEQEDDFDTSILGGDSLLFRKKTDNYKKASVEEELAWLDKALPQLSKEGRVKVVDGLIKASSTEKAWGAFTGSMVILSNNMSKGTVYHEAFHVVMNAAFTQSERNSVLSEARKMYGDLSIQELEELLAEDFREWKENEGVDTRNFGQKIIDMFKHLLSFTGLTPSLNYFYTNLNNGKYAEVKLDFSDNNRSVSTIKDAENKRNDLIQKKLSIQNEIHKLNASNFRTEEEARSALKESKIDRKIIQGIKKETTNGIDRFYIEPIPNEVIDRKINNEYERDVAIAEEIERQQNNYKEKLAKVEKDARISYNSLTEEARRNLTNKGITKEKFDTMTREERDYLRECHGF